MKDWLSADSIPSTIDVLIQRVRLMDLGLLALALGCTTDKANVQSHEFQAVGPYCILTPELIPIFGNAVRFEGDIDTLRKHPFGEYGFAYWQLAVAMVKSKIPFFDPVTMLKATSWKFSATISPAVAEGSEPILKFLGDGKECIRGSTYHKGPS